MKRRLLFFLTGLSFLMSQAQDLPDSMTYWKADTSRIMMRIGTIYFDYDAQGRVLTRSITNDGFGNEIREEFGYDGNGNLLQKRKRQRDNQNLFYTIDSQSYQYNSNQLLVRKANFYNNSQVPVLTLNVADSFAYSMDLNNRVNYREEYYAVAMNGEAMKWILERKDSLYYQGADTLPFRIYGFTWDQDSAKYRHTSIQDSLRWELGCDFELNFFPSDNYSYARDSNGVFQLTGRRFTTGPSGRIESQLQMIKFPITGFDTSYMLRYTWDSRGMKKLQEDYVRSNGDLVFQYSNLDSLVYTFNRITGRYLIYQNSEYHRYTQYYEYHYATIGLADINGQFPGFFPNPVRQGQELFLHPETEVLSIVSLSGQEQSEWSYDETNLIHKFAPGIYLVRMQQADRIFVQRLQVIP